MEKKEHIDQEKDKKSMLRVICEARVDGALEEELRNDEEYQKEEVNVCRAIDQIGGRGLSRQQWQAVDEALSACNDKGSEYGRAAYCLGFQDAVRFGVELFAKILTIDI